MTINVVVFYLLTLELFTMIPCSSEFKSFSYLYNDDHFLISLRSDVIIVKDLPPQLKEVRKRKECPIFKPKKSASPEYYINEVLPKLKKGKVIGLVVIDGGCLQVPVIILSCFSFSFVPNNYCFLAMTTMICDTTNIYLCVSFVGWFFTFKQKTKN